MIFTYLRIFIAAVLLLTSALAAPIPAKPTHNGHTQSRMTFYYTDVGLGACGNLNQNDVWTVALASNQYGHGYPSSNCGKKIRIQHGGKVAEAVVQDECPTCPDGGLDLSPSLFKFFAPFQKGIVNGKWEFID